MIFTDKYGVKRTTETYSQKEAKEYSNFSDNDLIDFNDKMKKLHEEAQNNNDWVGEYHYGNLIDASERQLRLRNIRK